MSLIKGERLYNRVGDRYPHGDLEDEYIYPSDWIDIRNPKPESITLLATDIGYATYAFTCTTSSGQYTVDWGDGTVTSHDSTTVAEHSYIVGTGKTCRHDYTLFKIEITGLITKFQIKRSSNPISMQVFPIVAASIHSTTLLDLSSAFYEGTDYNNRIHCQNIQYLRIQAPNVTTINCLFNWYANNLAFADISNMVSLVDAAESLAECYALRWVNVSGLRNLVNAGMMFEDCYALTKIDVSDFVSVQDANYMFSWDYALKEVKGFENMTEIVDASGMFYWVPEFECDSLAHLTKATDVSHFFGYNYLLTDFDCAGLSAVVTCDNMFQSCINLRSVNINALQNVTSARHMFNDCNSLQNVIADTFAQNSSSVDMYYCFINTPLTTISLPMAKIQNIYVYTWPSNAIKGNLETLSFHPSSLFGGVAPQIFISNNNISAEQINAIFTALPTLSGKSIDITGCTGAATCTRSIATAKGWTVTG